MIGYPGRLSVLQQRGVWWLERAATEDREADALARWARPFDTSAPLLAESSRRLSAAWWRMLGEMVGANLPDDYRCDIPDSACRTPHDVPMWATTPARVWTAQPDPATGGTVAGVEQVWLCLDCARSLRALGLLDETRGAEPWAM